jgi:hypothetical protein
MSFRQFCHDDALLCRVMDARRLRGFTGLCAYVRLLEHRARVNVHDRRRLLADRPDTLELLVQGEHAELTGRIRASLRDEIGGSESEADGVMGGEMVTTSEAADLLGIAARSVLEAKDRDQLKGRQDGRWRAWKFYRWSVEEYARTRRNR